MRTCCAPTAACTGSLHFARACDRRVALNFAYEQTADADYGESATLLYGGGLARR